MSATTPAPRPAVRFTGSGELDNGLTAGLNLEYAMGGPTPKLRQAYAVNINSEGGKLTIGHTGSDAADGSMAGAAAFPGLAVTNWCSYTTWPVCQK